MSRWIDADAMKEKIDSMWDGRPLSLLGARILVMIDKAPSIDIVRCKECKYAHLTYDGDCKYCDIWFPEESAYVSGDYFCASGERKESE